MPPYTAMYMTKMAISGKLWAQTIPRKDFNNTNGVLNNYHSFNYYLDNDMLQLNDILVKPFQDYKSKENINIAI